MKGFKTISAAGLITLIGLAEQSGVMNIIPDQYKGLAVAAIGLVMAVLRFQTHTPVGKNF